MSAKQDAIMAAMDIAEDIAAGRTQPRDLEQLAADALRELCATVIGPDDPAWDTQIDICRQVIALGGLTVDELLEWVAVRRQAEPAVEVAPGSGASWIEQALEAWDDDEGES